ncbi:serine hydrolase [Pontibacter sp. G13]|uniref:serine hydrolase domain-containing protein n=1 Tax=Pontibacter sp. G13 TaxID=3074898 RepID=UPI00288ACECD|nr:serine hydrolase [Pontibacter sp. G13]WNJ19092.1 serine hydrolase [Pontibacter sp. G13]
MSVNLPRLLRGILFFFCCGLIGSCGSFSQKTWNGPVLSYPRTQLTVESLLTADSLPLMDMSFFAQPDWAESAKRSFTGTITLPSTSLIFPKARAYYDGENLFPAVRLSFFTHGQSLVPTQRYVHTVLDPNGSIWDLHLGVGKIWNEQTDGAWDRASFPFTMTDRYIGQARNCVGTFVYQTDSISSLCIQCSQETADQNDQQWGDIRAVLDADFEEMPLSAADSMHLHHSYEVQATGQIPVVSLEQIDPDHSLGNHFERSYSTNASTSIGAVYLDGKLYLHPPKTHHGIYPYAAEMRHCVYSVTKSLTGALALMYLAERYGPEVFDALISDHVAPLADHPAWQGVTFAHALNMATGTEGSEAFEHLAATLILPLTQHEAMEKIAGLGDYPGAPGETFNYATTNYFVLSWALQHYVQEREGADVHYWELVHEHVLKPIGAAHFSLLHTEEADGQRGLPILGYGAHPTLDEAAKIARLFASNGAFEGHQLLHRKKVQEALGRTAWQGYPTQVQHRGEYYRHGFWSTNVKVENCEVEAIFMLGYGGNYIIFLPSGAIVFRFMDEFDLDIAELVKQVETLVPSCP